MGDEVEIQDWIFQVVEMEGRRIDRVLARPADPPEADAPETD